MTVVTISSPGCRLAPQVLATRLMASLALRVYTTSRSLAALMRPAILARAPSYSAVAVAASVCTPRCTLALYCSYTPVSLASTAAGFCDVAALSRYTSGWPFTCWCRMGKSGRRLSPRVPTTASTAVAAAAWRLWAAAVTAAPRRPPTSAGPLRRLLLLLRVVCGGGGGAPPPAADDAKQEQQAAQRSGGGRRAARRGGDRGSPQAPCGCSDGSGRRGGHPGREPAAGLPHPAPAGERPPAGVPRQRGDVAEAGGGAGQADGRVRAVQRQRAPRRAHAGGDRDGGV
mmetsp:Transcript_625/g.1546  ORF Transcript_625/g.1546 Transcript_625/m.1546 type:complete len:286 (-) Transcript_625:1509-2366(-)